MAHSSAEPRGPVVLAAGALILGALVFIAGEAAAAQAWSDPAYSYTGNFISDLGNPQCGPYDGRLVCSPLHGVMNAAFVGQGVLLGCAILLVGRALARRPRAALRWIGLLTAAGFVLLGVVHSSPEATENGTLWLHYVGATLAILGGNLTAIFLSRQWRRLRVPALFGGAGVILGTLGIMAAITWLATFGRVPPGTLERIAAYAFVLWQVGFGGLLVYTARQARVPGWSSAQAEKTP